MYLAEGLSSDTWPAAIKTSTKAISQGANYYTDFIEEICEITVDEDPEVDEFGNTAEEETFVYESDITQAWNRWVHANGLSTTPLTNLRKFKKMLRALGVQTNRCMVNGKRTYKYMGLRLRQ